MMDNLRVDITAHGIEALEGAIALAFETPRTLATYYVDLPALRKGPERSHDVPRTLVFCEFKEEGAFPLVAPVDAQGAADLAARWLTALPREDHGGAIDMDGDCLPDAFRVLTDGVPSERTTLGYRSALVAVQGWHRWIGK